MRIVRTEENVLPLKVIVGEVYESKVGISYILGSLQGTTHKYILTSLDSGACIELASMSHVKEFLGSKGAVHKESAVLRLNGDN